MMDLWIRKATYQDIDIIYNWANDPEVRKNSFNTNPIRYEDHCKWYNTKMQSPNTAIFVLMCGDIPVGQCRIDVDGEEGVISYLVDKNYRNLGYGKILLNMVSEKIMNEYPEISMLVAEVKEDNISSRKVFLSLGYIENIDKKKKVLTFRRNIK